MKKHLILFSIHIFTLCVLFASILFSVSPLISLTLSLVLALPMSFSLIKIMQETKKNKIASISLEEKGESKIEEECIELEQSSTPSMLDSQTSFDSFLTDTTKIESQFHELESKVFSIAYSSLFTSIVNYLNATSEPMSESLVTIKTSIADFIQKIQGQKKSYEGSGQSQSLRAGIESLRTHISEITQASAASCYSVTTEIKALDTQMTSILEIVTNISDVAERIHVLSINASIEAARAGVHGKGFKIIADEVQRLARETQGFVVTIGDSVAGTRDAFSSLYSFMDQNRAMTQSFVEADSTTYTEISKTVDTQIETVLTMYEAVLSFIEALQLDMNAFAPLGMLHAIITQEIENLERVVQDFVALASENSSTKTLTQDQIEQLVKQNVDRIRTRLTTSRELHALAKSLDVAGLTHNVDLKQIETEIEFF